MKRYVEVLETSLDLKNIGIFKRQAFEVHTLCYIVYCNLCIANAYCIVAFHIFTPLITIYMELTFMGHVVNSYNSVTLAHFYLCMNLKASEVFCLTFPSLLVRSKIFVSQ